MEVIASLWSERKHDFSSASPQLFYFYLKSNEKKKSIRRGFKDSRAHKSFGKLTKYQSKKKKSDILWWHILVIHCCCCMKYWKQRYVGVDFDHCRPCLSSVALLPCQAGSKHTATCVTGQGFPQNSRLPCSAYLQQWWLLKIQGAARPSLIYLLASLMLRVTLKRKRWCTRVDTGTLALICDTSQWTSRDKGFHADKLSHAL